ncbi:MAG: helix-turn-helix domain-containing protein, partial [Myxococcota bacterium]
MVGSRPGRPHGVLIGNTHGTPMRLRLGLRIVDLDRRVVDGPSHQTMTPLEAAVLRYLATRPGTVVSRSDIEREVWGLNPAVQSHTVAVCVRRLRSKIEDNPSEARHLKTVRGTGWVLEGVE